MDAETISKAGHVIKCGKKIKKESDAEIIKTELTKNRGKNKKMVRFFL